nr:type II toxin-antitoxin system VapC family toxin [Sphingomonas sp. JUb134]
MGEERHARRVVKALDTNVVLRLLVPDDPDQTRLAEEQMQGPVLLPLTVLLETAWVLGSRYGFSRAQIVSILTHMLDQPQLTAEAVDQLPWALERYAAGGDLADMLHLVAARGADAFVTFDRAIAKSAGPNSPLPVETLA